MHFLQGYGSKVISFIATISLKLFVNELLEISAGCTLLKYFWYIEFGLKLNVMFFSDFLEITLKLF